MAGATDIPPVPGSVAPNLGQSAEDEEWNNILREASKMGSNIGENVEKLPVGERTGRPDYGGGTAAAVGTGQGLTAGWSAKGGALVDTFLSKAPPALREQLEKWNAAGGGHPGLSPLTEDKTFSQRLAEYNQRNNDLEATHGGPMHLGQLVGGVGLGALGPTAATSSVPGALGRGAAGGAIAGAGYSKGDPTTAEGRKDIAIDSGIGAGIGGALGVAGHAIGKIPEGASERIDKRNIATISEDTKKKFADKIYDDTDNVARTIRRDADIQKTIGRPKELLPVIQQRLDAADAVADKIYAHAYADSVKPSETPVAAEIIKRAEAAEERAASLKNEMSSLPAGARDSIAAKYETAAAEAKALRREAASKIVTARQIRGVPSDDVIGALSSVQKEFEAASRPQEAAAVAYEIAAFKSGLGADPGKPPSPMKVREFLTRMQARAQTNDPQGETPLAKQGLMKAAGAVRNVLHGYVEEHAPGQLPLLIATNKKISAYRMIEDSAQEQLRRDVEPAGPIRAIGNVIKNAVTSHGTAGKLGTAGAVVGGLHGAMSGKGFAMGALEGGAIGGTIGSVGTALAPVADKAAASKLGQWALFGGGKFTARAIPQPVIDAATQANDPRPLRQHLQDSIFGDDNEATK